MFTPAADIDVDENVVRSLLRQQHPDLAELSLRLVASGWDNVIYRLGDDLVVRVPRRSVAAGLLENENRWLPVLGQAIHATIPVPLRTGVPSESFPWPWSVSAWIDGRLASETPFHEHDSLASDLASFVRDLHTPAPPDAPENPVRGVPLATRSDAVGARLQTGRVPHVSSVSAIWQSALATEPWTGPALWLHGDLHPANILTRDGGLAAVIDFGDLTAGDPATDLATAWLTFDPSGRETFTGSLVYDDATWARARGWALVMGTALLANSADSPAMNRIGQHVIEQILLDS